MIPLTPGKRELAAKPTLHLLIMLSKGGQQNMTLDEIKAAVTAGRRVFWQNRSYEVIKDRIGQWLIIRRLNGFCNGLTARDGVTLMGREEDFFTD